MPRQLGYFNRLPVRPEHRDWFVDTLATTSPDRLGRMIAFANSLVFLVIAVLLGVVLGGGPVALTFLLVALAIAVLGQVPAIVRFRVRQLATTNGLDPPDWAA